MTPTALAAAQAEVRYAYRSASVGQIFSGLVWLISAAVWSLFGTTAGVLSLLVGGVFIYPVTSLVSRMWIFIPLGLAMWMVGFALGLWAPGVSVLGAWLTGLALLAVGVWAGRQHSLEFGQSDSG